MRTISIVLASAPLIAGLFFTASNPGAPRRAGDFRDAPRGGGALSDLYRAGPAVPEPSAAPVPAAPGKVDSGGPAGSDLWNAYLARAFGGVKTRASRPDMMLKGAAGDAPAIESVDLEKILNSNLKTGLTFRTSSGGTVHVSGAQAANCDKDRTSCTDNDRYFLLFSTERGETKFVKGQRIANALMVSGEQEISFDGAAEKYLVKLFLKLTDPPASRLVVTASGRPTWEITLGQLTAALANKGTRLRSGAQHNLYYNTEVVQDAAGNGRFGKGRVLTFAPRKDENLVVNESEISSEGAVFRRVEPYLGFRIVDGVLEVYRS